MSDCLFLQIYCHHYWVCFIVCKIHLNGESSWHSAADIYLFLVDVYIGRMIYWLSVFVSLTSIWQATFHKLNQSDWAEFQNLSNVTPKLKFNHKIEDFHTTPLDNFKIFFFLPLLSMMYFAHQNFSSGKWKWKRKWCVFCFYYHYFVFFFFFFLLCRLLMHW